MAAHGGRSECGWGIRRCRLGCVILRLLKQSTPATMRARYLGALVVRRVFQMLIAILAGAFVHAGRCHLGSIETSEHSLRQG